MNSSTIKDRASDRVLVVDDSPTNRLLLRSMLSKAGFIVDECENGRCCIEYCSSHSPDMVLLDIMMPEMDGIECCKFLRSMFSKDELPIIMVTTKSEGEDVAIGLEVGANDYVTKPVDRVSLLARIENQLVSARAKRELERQRRSLERALKIQNAMGDVLPDAAAVQDGTGILLYSNELLGQLCGGAIPGRIDEVIELLLDGALTGPAAATLRHVAENPSLEFDEELRLDQSGARFLRVITRPVTLDDGTWLRVWLLRDMTHLRLLEQRERQQVRIEAVGVFSAGIAHNFNNLLGAILGAAEMLERYTGDHPKAERCLKIIEGAIRDGKALTEKVAGFSQRQLHAQCREGGEDAQDALGRIIREVAEASSGKQIDVEVMPAAERCLTALARDDLELVLRNIVQNAFDSIDQCGTVRACARSGPDGVEIRVTDSGCGMNDRDRERVCEPFFSTKNLDEVNQVSYQGNGLGMWNVYNLVKLSGGELEISSALGQGTSIVLRLPTWKEEQ